jgi:SpoVK/Ycf46/Vps4 family AAA+-type ATPase
LQASKTIGYVGADLKSLVRESVMRAISSGLRSVTRASIDAALSGMTASTLQGSDLRTCLNPFARLRDHTTVAPLPILVVIATTSPVHGVHCLYFLVAFA